MNQPLLIHSANTMDSIAIIARIKSILPDQWNHNYVVTVDILDWQTRKTVQSNVCFNVSMTGIQSSFNYSVGETFGAVLSSCGTPANTGYSFDLRSLSGAVVLGFVHYRRTKQGNEIQTLNDIYPIQMLNTSGFSNV